MILFCFSCCLSYGVFRSSFFFFCVWCCYGHHLASSLSLLPSYFSAPLPFSFLSSSPVTDFLFSFVVVVALSLPPPHSPTLYFPIQFKRRLRRLNIYSDHHKLKNSRTKILSLHFAWRGNAHPFSLSPLSCCFLLHPFSLSRTYTSPPFHPSPAPSASYTIMLAVVPCTVRISLTI